MSLPNIQIFPKALPLAAELREVILQDPGFGQVFTDHMFTARWQTDLGWHDAKIGAWKPFRIDPACSMLHYAQTIFEGMKAFRTAKDGVTLFRPEQNARRFARSAERMAMPAVPEQLFLEAVKALVAIDRDWIPRGDGSLYLRPFMFASESFLGIRPAKAFTFCIIGCPAGPYFKRGENALSLWLSQDLCRAAPGGTGAAKCGGNYAGSLLAQEEAIRQDCDQVVFLDAVERRWIEELGGMNLFFVMADGEVVTPPLNGTILAGITRDSIMTLARDRGLKVAERAYSIEDWREDAVSGRLTETFACGTAAVVAGVGRVRSRSGDFEIGDGGVGPVTRTLRDKLVALQRGASGDPHGWLTSVD